MHNVNVRCQCTMFMYDVNARCLCTMSMYDVNAQCQCTMSMYDVYVRCQCTMSMWDVNARCTTIIVQIPQCTVHVSARQSRARECAPHSLYYTPILSTFNYPSPQKMAKRKVESENRSFKTGGGSVFVRGCKRQSCVSSVRRQCGCNERTQHKGAITPDKTFKRATAPKRAGPISALESCFDLEL